MQHRIVSTLAGQLCFLLLVSTVACGGMPEDGPPLVASKIAAIRPTEHFLPIRNAASTGCLKASSGALGSPNTIQWESNWANCIAASTLSYLTAFRFVDCTTTACNAYYSAHGVRLFQIQSPYGMCVVRQPVGYSDVITGSCNNQDEALWYSQDGLLIPYINNFFDVLVRVGTDIRIAWAGDANWLWIPSFSDILPNGRHLNQFSIRHKDTGKCITSGSGLATLGSCDGYADQVFTASPAFGNHFTLMTSTGACLSARYDGFMESGSCSAESALWWMPGIGENFTGLKSFSTGLYAIPVYGTPSIATFASSAYDTSFPFSTNWEIVPQ